MFRLSLFGLNSPNQYLQWCQRQQIDQKIALQTQVFEYSQTNCLETCIAKPMMQNHFFSHKEAP